MAGYGGKVAYINVCKMLVANLQARLRVLAGIPRRVDAKDSYCTFQVDSVPMYKGEVYFSLPLNALSPVKLGHCLYIFSTSLHSETFF